MAWHVHIGNFSGQRQTDGQRKRPRKPRLILEYTRCADENSRPAVSPTKLNGRDATWERLHNLDHVVVTKEGDWSIGDAVSRV